MNLFGFCFESSPFSATCGCIAKFFISSVALGGGSYFQSNEFAKGSVSLTRTRASTMLKPAALEKKMARMASRAALRPPVPGAGNGNGNGYNDDDSESD